MLIEPIVEGVPPSMLGIGAGWLLVGIFVLAILRGKLVPKATVDRIETQHQQQLERVEHDRDEWRTEGRLKDAQIAEQNKQLGMLAEVGETVKQLAQGIQREAGL